MQRPRVSGDIENLRRTSSGWEGRVALYTDEAGYFGRRCPATDCHAFFKLRTDEFAAAPESLEFTCPECGHTAYLTLLPNSNPPDFRQGCTHVGSQFGSKTRQTVPF